MPTQQVRTLRGMRKYSTVRPSAKELGGMMQQSPLTRYRNEASNFLGSTTEAFTLVKIWNSSAMRMS